MFLRVYICTNLYVIWGCGYRHRASKSYLTYSATEGQSFSFWFYTAAYTGDSHVFHLNASEFRYPKEEGYTILLGMFNGVGVFGFVFSKGQVM